MFARCEQYSQDTKFNCRNLIFTYKPHFPFIFSVLLLIELIKFITDKFEIRIFKLMLHRKDSCDFIILHYRTNFNMEVCPW